MMFLSYYSGDVPQCPVSERYPKRLIQLKKYREDELSDEDEYQKLWK